MTLLERKKIRAAAVKARWFWKRPVKDQDTETTWWWYINDGNSIVSSSRDRSYKFAASILSVKIGR